MIKDRLIIKDILIRQYRSCLDTHFELHPDLSVLIGPNSSGKTNIMNALFLLRRLTTEESPPFYSRDVEPTGHCKVKTTLTVGKVNATLWADIDTYTDASNTDIVITSDQYWNIKQLTGNNKRVKLPLALARELMRPADSKFISYYQRRISADALQQISRQTPPPIRAFLGRIALNLAQIRYYSASQFTNPANCPVSFELEKDEKTTRPGRLAGHAKFLFDLYNSHKYSKARYLQFIDIIGPNGIGLVDDIYFKEISTSSVQHSVRIGGTVTERKKRNILVIPQFKIGKNALSPNQLSEGTFKTITLLFYLITEPSQLLLIEEPEVCVHHGLLSSIIELIKTYADTKQIVISTHSDFVLDMVQPENVYAVTNIPQEGTKVHHIPKRLSRNELEALRDYLQTEGNLGEYWRAGGLE
jgi:ABC-type branched-subunit amino acid transport system ATPase component